APGPSSRRRKDARGGASKPLRVGQRLVGAVRLGDHFGVDRRGWWVARDDRATFPYRRRLGLGLGCGGDLVSSTPEGVSEPREPESVATGTGAVAETQAEAQGETQVEASAGAKLEPLRPSTHLIGDGVSLRETYAVNLEIFEGPLDLLLHLVRRHELDILDIPIAFVTEKYVEYLAFARALDIEIAGEYLVMAATLAYLKSRELLPRDPEAEEEPEDDEGEAADPREELIRRLLEYERFRAAGDELDARPVVGRDVFGRGGDVDV